MEHCEGDFKHGLSPFLMEKNCPTVLPSSMEISCSAWLMIVAAMDLVFESPVFCAGAGEGVGAAADGAGAPWMVGAVWMVGAAWVGTGAAMAFTSAAPVLLSLSLAIFFLTCIL